MTVAFGKGIDGGEDFLKGERRLGAVFYHWRPQRCCGTGRQGLLALPTLLAQVEQRHAPRERCHPRLGAGGVLQFAYLEEGRVIYRLYTPAAKGPRPMILFLHGGGNGGSEGERTIVKDEHYRGGKVKFVPGFSYTLYAKRDGYFSVFREFNSRELMLRDTIMLYNMERTERGSTFPISNVYFEDSEATLIGGSDTVLMDYVAMFLNHPEITFLVKAYVSTYGVNAEEDMLLSLERAKTVKDFFVKHGIAAERMTTAGMTRNEIKRAAAAALDTKSTFSNIKVELIITGKTTDQQ